MCWNDDDDDDDDDDDGDGLSLWGSWSFLPLDIFDTLGAKFDPLENLGFHSFEWSCAIMITTHHKSYEYIFTCIILMNGGLGSRPFSKSRTL